MAQIPPSPSQPPHQQLPPLLSPQPAQEPMSPLPHNMTRVVRIPRTAANLDARKARVGRDLANEVKRLRRGCGGGGSTAGRGERGGQRRGSEHGAARADERESTELRTTDASEWCVENGGPG
jgi:hypothetical protein